MYKKHHKYNMYSCEPYMHSYDCFAKGRWIGRKIFDVLQSEFMLYDSDYYGKAIEDGRITINGQKCTKDTIVRSPDKIQHRAFVTEPYIGDISQVNIYGVLDWELTSKTSDLYAVYKPSNVPVHASGSYQKNTLVGVIKEKFNITIHPLHRLDRLTSGIMLFSTAPKAHQSLFTDHLIQKEYYCLVKGEVDFDSTTVDVPIASYCGKRGLQTLDDNGKPSQTKFVKVLAKDGNTLLKAYPLTGRTHQIRLHCLHLGHPIVNDPIYKHGLPSPGTNLSRNSDITVDNEIYLHANAYYLNGKKIICPIRPDWIIDLLNKSV
eukprot:NODE_44_length_28780_cov_0.148496.p8 type:complete len:319 gc:universal NODE_44_length_28780_cov_0.148496:116-1072(+)